MKPVNRSRRAAPGGGLFRLHLPAKLNNCPGTDEPSLSYLDETVKIAEIFLGAVKAIEQFAHSLLISFLDYCDELRLRLYARLSRRAEP